MSEENTNVGNPLNLRHDEETRNAPHVTPVPAEAQADDLFDDTAEVLPVDEEANVETTPNCPVPRRNARNPRDESAMKTGE